jgi:chlorophyll a/b binding light-harvesting protein
LFLGLGNIQFVEWARIHGIYDASQGITRTVNYNLDLGMIWNHQADFLSINSLEDVMGGHAFLAFFLIIGGAFHIATKNVGEYTEFKGKGLLSAESVLSYSLAGVAYCAFVAAFWCASNTTIYPTDLYGEVLKLQFDFAPYFTDTAELQNEMHTARAWLSNVHFYLGFFFLQGHLWHALRGMGFDFKRIGKAFDNMENAKITAG